VRDTDHGSFVRADHADADFDSTASDQFLIQTIGGAAIGHNHPKEQLEVDETVKLGMNWHEEPGTFRCEFLLKKRSIAK
jgi:hypothetical protein